MAREDFRAAPSAVIAALVAATHAVTVKPPLNFPKNPEVLALIIRSRQGSPAQGRR
jgi:hypothetical protein